MPYNPPKHPKLPKFILCVPFRVTSRFLYGYSGTYSREKESDVARILIVEDEANIIKLISIRLERLGHSISSADNGVAALKVARESTPDLILLDVMIPVLNGFQVLQQLKADPTTAPIPVLMLTARGHERDIVAGL